MYNFMLMLQMKDIIEQVDIERLYQHILNVEGIKHPILAQKKLDETADYIKNKFMKYGLQVQEQVFKIEDFDQSFRNIEGYFENSSGPEVLITSHYDTVINAPGANDNGSAIAIMLEAARILAKEKETNNIRFVSFTLEEFNPSRELKQLKLAQELELMDENYRFLTYHTQKMYKECFNFVYRNVAKGRTLAESWELALKEIMNELTDQEKKYFEFISQLYSKDTYTSWIGKAGMVGSSEWVAKAMRDKREIIGVINNETVGYTAKRKNSQIYPPLMHPILFPSYKVKQFKAIGNFITVVSDKKSKMLAKSFSKQCKNDSIQLPYIRIRIPLSFETIAKRFFDLLRSDHAPFWLEGIPALMITDSANFRYPFYHTEADTIDKLDFNFIKKVCQVTIATAIDSAKKHKIR